MKKIVIIGAGYSGILTAKRLAKKFKKDPEISISIIDKNPYHTMLTELHEVAAGRVEEKSIRISLKKVFAGRRVNIIHDLVESIDTAGKTVSCKNGSYEYDYLVIAAGSRPTYFGIPGAEEYAYPLWSYNDAVKLNERILGCFRQASEETDPGNKKRLLTFYVVGAGLTGVEMAGELAEYVPTLCEIYEIDRKQVTIVNVDFLSRAVPTLPEKLSAKIKARLEKMSVDVLLGTRVAEIGQDFIDLEKDSEKARHEAGTIIWTAGIESAEITQKIGETLPCAKRGRLNADEHLKCPTDDSIYIVGDNLFYTPPGEKEPVPQMVENCEQSAHTAADNIYCAVTGRGKPEPYKPRFHGTMVSVGGRYGTARVGTSKRMLNLPSFLAMFTKHFINIVYFIQVLGWNKVSSYLKHEFFIIRDKRSFVGGHFSNRTPSFLLVALRLWLGVVWLFEGVMKVVEGWLKSPKLKGFFGGAYAWFEAILNKTDAISATTSHAAQDAVSSATGAIADTGAAAGTVLIDWNILGIIRPILVSGKPLAESTLADYAFKLNIPVIDWFVTKVITPSDGVQMVMQVFVVLAEILIGLSMIGGLFTTLSSVVSLLLLFMFASTTGLYLSNIWMVFGAIALLFGAGSIFGLDYYTTPLLKKSWKRRSWVRRLYIYHD